MGAPKRNYNARKKVSRAPRAGVAPDVPEAESVGVTVEADVVVFGAGITGLTIAHELAERNFRVAVIDPAYRGKPPLPQIGDLQDDQENPGLGGMAKSQWCYWVNDEMTRDPLQGPLEPERMKRAYDRQPGTEPVVVEYEVKQGRVTFGRVAFDGSDAALALNDAVRPTPLAALLIPFVRSIEAIGGQIVFTRSAPKGKDQLGKQVLAALTEAGRQLGVEVNKDWIEAHAAMNSTTRWASKSPRMRIELNLFMLPGEHGFRFFPSFYRHIFDLLKRIPNTDRESGERVGQSTVFDNLTSVDFVGYAGNTDSPSVPDGPTARLERRAPRSLRDVERLMFDMKRETRYTDADLRQIALKVWKYMTSSRQRREREYENISWYEFVGGDEMSPRGQYLTETTPGTLGALFGSDSDARTQGTIMLQCAAVQFNDGAMSDMLLNGPTDEAWFGPWFRHLDSQRVEFYRGSLRDFELVNGSVEPVASTEPDDPKGPQRFTFKPLSEGGLAAKPVIFVLALPLIQSNEMARRFSAAVGPARASAAVDFAALRDFTNGIDFAAEMQKAYPDGPLKHLSGIQYFFNQRLGFGQSHILYIDASAGLTAVSQPQFWLTPGSELSGFRSVLSVDIATWGPSRFPTAGPQPSPWYPWGEREGVIAEQIWDQITVAHRGDYPTRWPRLPTPALYHLDDNLEFDPSGRLAGNRTPFMVNQTGRFRRRPGGRPAAPPTWKAPIEYHVAEGRYMMAGVFMQTYTRINSMEAACESGRHAVNAILRHLDVPNDPCPIWDPEDFEPLDLTELKELDDQLYTRGQPHVVDALSENPGMWSWPDGDWTSIIDAARSGRRA